MVRRVVWVCCWCVVSVFAAGCAGGGPVAVSGAVTLDGKPVGAGESGTIRFQPVDPANGQAAEGVIKDGRYEALVLPGAYHVNITWYKHLNTPADPALYGPGGDEKASLALIPAKYARAGALTATVSADAPQADFVLDSK